MARQSYKYDSRVFEFLPIPSLVELKSVLNISHNVVH